MDGGVTDLTHYMQLLQGSEQNIPLFCRRLHDSDLASIGASADVAHQDWPAGTLQLHDARATTLDQGSSLWLKVAVFIPSAGGRGRRAAGWRTGPRLAAPPLAFAEAEGNAWNPEGLGVEAGSNQAASSHS